MNEGQSIRQSTKSRTTAETDIKLALVPDGKGKTAINTGFGMLDHMLGLMAFWASLDLDISCRGDLHIDAHHTIEDIGLVFGAALLEALGDRRGIARIGHARVPMDEAMADVAIDISGRPWLEWRGDELLPPLLAGEERDIWREFFKSVANAGKLNIHITFLYGKNGHHLIESAFKGFGVSLCQAMQIHGTTIRSSKGELD